MRITRIISCLIATATAAPAFTAGLEIGHPNFMPSREQPVGWRADGSGLTQGIWPGATPPPPDAWGFARRQNVSKDMVWPGLYWKVMCPNQTIASPIVVGDLVITLADPQTVLAYDANSGELRWFQNADHLDKVFAGNPAKAREIRKLWTVVDTLFFKYNLAPTNKAKRGSVKDENARRRRVFEESLGMTWQEGIAILKKHGISEPNGSGWRGPKGIPKRMKKQFLKWGLWQRGYSTMGLTEATPVSDGKWLWVSYVSNTVTCYEVATGKVRWMRFFGGKTEISEDIMSHGKQRGRWPVSKFYPSPLLIGDMLVIQHGHHIRGLHADSGKTVWEFPYCKTYYGTGTPVRMRFNGADFIITARGWVVRVSDGAVLTRAFHDLARDRQLGGSSMFTNGDDVIVMSDSGTGGGHGRQKVMAFRLSLNGSKIESKQLWSVDKAANEGSGLCYGGWVYENGFARNKRRINVETGQVDGIGTGYLNRYGGGYGSVHVAGSQLLDWDGGDTFVGFRLQPGGGLKPLETAKLHFQKFYGDMKGKIRDPFDPTFKQRYRKARLEAWQAGQISYFDATTQDGGEAYGQHAWFKGDRIYLRTRWELYCFGPPARRAGSPKQLTTPTTVARPTGTEPSANTHRAANTSARSTPASAEPPRDIVARWEPALMALIAHHVRAGEHPRFHMSEAGRDAAIVGVAEDKLLVTSRGIEASYALEDLGLQAKASIAGQVADGSSTKQAAVAAFFYLAAGQESLGRTWLASAGRHASVVRKSLNDR